MSTCFWGLLVGVLRHAAACRSTLKIGLGFFLGKISDQNINPILEQSSVRDWQYPSGQMLQLQLRTYACQPGTHARKFQLDITRKFSATNIPLEKLGYLEMKDFFAKYLAVHPIKKQKYKEEE